MKRSQMDAARIEDELKYAHQQADTHQAPPHRVHGVLVAWRASSRPAQVLKISTWKRKVTTRTPGTMHGILHSGIGRPQWLQWHHKRMQDAQTDEEADQGVETEIQKKF